MKELKYEYILNWNLTLDCNLSCKYCNAKILPNTLIGRFQATKIGIHFTNMIWKYVIRRTKHLKSPETIDTRKIVSLIDRMGKPAKIKLLGGEPFLHPYFIEICKELSKTHYLGIESNFSTDRVKSFCDEINPERVDLIRAALHIEQLEKRKLVERFIDNAIYCKTKGFHIETLIVGHPTILEKIHSYREILESNGIPFYVQPFVGHYKGKEYPASYSHEEKEKYKINLYDSSYIRNTKNQLCTAGYRYLAIYPSGDIFPCNQIINKIGNIYEEFTHYDTMMKCPFDKCLNEPRTMNPELFNKIINEYLSSKDNPNDKKLER
jgi:MoaA/NifB/PqqE/SkfB family radical SAM enzyme